MKQARFFDDLEVGETWVSPPVEITVDAIVAFALQFDPQPMHADPIAASSGPFKGLIASGWHVAAAVMRQLVDDQLFGETPILGLGIDQLRWVAPVRPSDLLIIRRRIIELEQSQKNPAYGSVRMSTEVENQDGRVVMRFESLTRMPLR